ncbi:MAG: Fe-S cluster assembly protein SufD [Hyphomicrobiales bacterium]|nr:Fe-S cluster assembly protein SufD [Hyphomicrobiales bacterium]
MTSLTPIRTKAETALLAQFEELRAELPKAGAGNASRKAAMAAFAATGLPHRRIEAYHYTDLRNLLREPAPLAPSAAGKAGRSVEAGRFLGDLGAHEIILVNGKLMDGQDLASQLPKRVSIAKVTDTAPAILDANDPVVALNTALSRETVAVTIGKGVKLDRPLHVSFVQDAGAPQAVYARLKVVVGEGASVTLLETHEGPNGIATQSNTGVEIVAGDNASIEHVRVNAEGDKAFVLSSLGLSLGRETSALSLNLTLGAAISRHQIFARMLGEEAKLRLNGVAMLDGDRHADVTLVVDHAVPGGESRELFKTAVDQRANGVFQGKIIVRPHAQKTDGKMMSAALLLSEDASMNNKPELEIFADDVQCGHGATCGALDENLLFYLMARGIARRDAQALLIRSFLGEAIEELSNEALREALGELIDGWLMRRA